MWFWSGAMWACKHGIRSGYGCKVCKGIACCVHNRQICKVSLSHTLAHSLAYSLHKLFAYILHKSTTRLHTSCAQVFSFTHRDAHHSFGHTHIHIHIRNTHTHTHTHTHSRSVAFLQKSAKRTRPRHCEKRNERNAKRFDQREKRNKSCCNVLLQTQIFLSQSLFKNQLSFLFPQNHLSSLFPQNNLMRSLLPRLSLNASHQTNMIACAGNSQLDLLVFFRLGWFRSPLFVHMYII